MFAGMARRRRAREMERRLRELDHWDELYGLGGVPSSPPRRPRRQGGGGGVLLLVLGLGAAAILFPTQSRAVLDRATDLLPGGGDQPVAWADEVGAVVQEAVPLGGPPGAEQAAERVLPEVAVSLPGDYQFLQTQPGSDEPVGFSPCAPVEVVVNPDGAPDDYTQVVEGSLARVSAASGVLLQLVGETDDTIEEPRTARDPVLITWATEAEVPDLAGRTAGYGGPLIMTDGISGRSWLASGSVVIDRADLEGQGPIATGVVLDHELGHVMGLDHVADPQELMAAMNTGQTGFGPGDLAGLARLGAIDCA